MMAWTARRNFRSSLSPYAAIMSRMCRPAMATAYSLHPSLSILCYGKGMVGRHPKAAFPYAMRSGNLRDVLLHQRSQVLKISRTELATRSRVSVSTIRAIEEGRTLDPGLFTVISLAVALNLDLGQMMTSVTGPIRARPLHDTDTA
ncbi:helix-turn-helix domain-containing protein [Microbacterium phyllosphaerae]|uniref:helix-turn-helix domain-containing protein n=1 Tax=Microbacterium phyllosphaerae TaxID=124798 RepID=UPI000EA2750F